ncbi:MAG: DEAD/DEAH box helicase [Acidimicrobiales bacterium]
MSDIPLTIEVDYAFYHPLVPDFAAVTMEAQIRAGAVGNNARRRPTVPINPAWRRDNRHVSFTIAVRTDDDEVRVSSRDGHDPFEEDAQAAVTDHYARPDALWKLRTNQTLPVADALGSEAQFRNALDAKRDITWQPMWPQPELTITTMPMVEGDIGVSVSIANASVLVDRQLQDLSIYDTRMTVTVEQPARLTPQLLSFAKEDLRYSDAATVVGRGRGCVAVPGGAEDSIFAETLPRYCQPVASWCDHGVDLTFSGLAAEHALKLSAIASAMREFFHSWDMDGSSGEHRAQLEQRRVDFEAEIERFELGCDLLRRDPRLDRAFGLTNRTFANAKGSNGSWRLFQLVFVVSQLGALAAREDRDDAGLRAELETVDVLWFPTGGGKTEAYLGLITAALFFDRMRDKLRGTTAWMLFPLRMLSVQQLARFTEIIHHAEAIRLSEGIKGDPFTLGYFVGAGNTPNRLGPPASNSWWPGLEVFSRRKAEERDVRRLVGSCPACRALNGVGLDVDLSLSRLVHVCRQCGYVLPIYSSDEEVYRFQPSVVVSTVDKITSFSYSGQLTSINRGPRKQCPQHGWYTHSRCIVRDCETDTSTHVGASGFYDPTPALWIQDELHLVREDLGVFASHYHTLIAELAAGAGHLPSKVIAATATIEQYKDQLSQVYGRTPRMFPIGGPTLRRSFYTEITNDVQRLYLGVLPAGGGTVKVDLAGDITCQLVRAVHDLMDDPRPLIATLNEYGIAINKATARAHLFDYELALAYVNSKAHGVAIQDDLFRLSEELISSGSDRVRIEYLMGDTPLGELAGVVASVQGDTTAVPRTERIRALVGTAVVAHGVDLDRLNIEVVAGMPSSYAMYIQATSRAGRRHVGVVISIFDRNNRRETSMYQSFATTHAALERMVEPVPVNRFASRAVERTLPGIVCALLWDETRNPAWPSTDEISMTRKFRPWWNAVSAGLLPHLRRRIAAAYRCPVSDMAMAAEEQKLIDDALERWESVERQRMQQWQAEWITELFTTPAMTSLRDVEPPVVFSGGPRSDQIISRLND